MAGGQERILKRRIRSVESTRKTTRAMELIAGSRIVRAQQRIAADRPYVDRVNALSADLAAAPGGSEHRLLAPVENPERLALVGIVSDRGLCGAYNADGVASAGAQAGGTGPLGSHDRRDRGTQSARLSPLPRLRGRRGLRGNGRPSHLR